MIQMLTLPCMNAEDIVVDVLVIISYQTPGVSIQIKPARSGHGKIKVVLLTKPHQNVLKRTAGALKQNCMTS